MSKEKITINDFNLFFQSLKAVGKLVTSAKISINSEGMTIYGKNSFARGELFTNSITANSNPIEFCLLDLSMFIKVLSTVSEIHENDFSDVNVWFEFPFIKIESKKFKTKLSTCKEEVIANNVSQKIKTQLNPVFEFITSSKQIKYVNSHSFILSDLDSARIYIATDSTMENNVVYAKIGNESNELNNFMILKLGMVTMGNIEDRKLIINFDRLNILNVIDSDEIKIQLMDKNVLVNTSVVYDSENNNSEYFYKFTIYTSLLAN